MKHQNSALLISLVLLLSISLFGQRGGITRNPLEVGLDYSYFDSQEDQQILATLAFKRATGFIPKFSPYITSEFLSLSGGIRTYSVQDSTELRWRAVLYNGEFVFRSFTVGFTLADLDERGLFQEDYRWAAIRLGFGKVFGNGFLNIYPQISGSFAGGQWVLGEIDHPELGAAANNELSGQEAGYQGLLGIRLANRFLVTALYNERILIDGPEPKIKTLSFELRYRIPLSSRRNQLQLFAGWSREETSYSANELEQEISTIKAGLRFAFRRGARKPGSGFGGDPLFD
ncbi:MAG: hypothetical protein ACRBF0_18615 [Calditrichia bacterium]